MVLRVNLVYIFNWQSNKVVKALSYYSRARATLDDAGGYSSEETEAKAKLSLSIHLNCALCQLKLEQWNEVISSCDCALNIESPNEKALYRKAQVCSVLYKDLYHAITVHAGAE